jgi:hypothetical protein
MSDQAPEMKAMFGGKPGGGFFDLPLARPGDTRDADVILLGADRGDGGGACRETA